MRMRMLLKTVWKQIGQDWDRPLASEEIQLFAEWAEELQIVKEFRIQRKYFQEDHANYQLHLFSDASLEAMCMVAYLRPDINENADISFVIGKCRIAPMKQLSIPRLELQAALYAVRLRQLITSEHDLGFTKFYHWTDSVTVLHWLHSANKKQNVFVGNRVAEILEGSTIDEWKFVNGTLNPADIGTRGMTVKDLNESEWITGPAWLKHDNSCWPEQPSYFESTCDEDGIAATTLLATDTELNEVFFDWKRFSSYQKYIRLIDKMSSF